MKQSAILYYLLLSFAIAAGVTQKIGAQVSPAYSYQFYNSSHGLPSSEIICLAKDTRGFLWLGTSAGLSMYDGYTFQNYPYSKGKEWIGYVNVIRPDTCNRLWIGSGAGLFCFVNNEIIKISAATSSPQGVNDILLNQDGNIWLATENGPAHFNMKDADMTGKKKLPLSNLVLPVWLQKIGIKENREAFLISQGKDDAIFIAQNNNLYRLWDNKLDLIYTTSGRDRITSLFPVSNSKIYFAAVETELNKIENGVATNINPEKLFNPGNSKNDGDRWYPGTRGLFCFNPETGTVSAYHNSIDDHTIWPSAVMEEAGFLWIASHDGLVKVKRSIFSTYPSPITPGYNDYYSITALKNGTILLGANRGKVLQKKSAGFQLYKDQLVPLAEITSMYEDERGWLWITSGYQGIVLLRNGKTERYTIEDGLHDNSVYHFLKTSSGNLYVFGDAGMSEILVNKDNSISFKKFLYRPNSTRYAKFFSGIESPDGTIWMGGEEGIVYLHNGTLHQFSLNGKQVSVSFMLKDKQDKIWIAAQGEGLLRCVFNKRNELEIEQQFTENEGLNTMYYLTLLADNENNIWAGSSKGISVIGGSGKYKNRILNFDESDGFIKPGYSHIAMFQSADSSIWAATTLGFMSFKPSQLFIDNTPLDVYITGVRQTKRNHPDTLNSFAQHPVTNKFSYSNNSFNFTFAALDFENPGNIHYYYKLEGLDTNWVPCGKQRSISFENLSPGNYLLRVKALSSKGIWSTNDAVYAFTIITPFWKQRWFISLLLLTIIALSIFLLKRRISFIKKRESEKTELQKIKTASYQARLEAEQVINYFATSISGQTTVADMLWDVAENLIGKLGFEDCMIYLWNKDKTILLQSAGFGSKGSMQSELDKSIYHVPKGKGIVGAAVESRHSILANDTALDKRYFSADGKIRSSELCVPIIHNNEAIGAINAEHSTKNFYTDRHLQILTTIASMLADKIYTIEAQQQTREKELEVLKLNKDLATSQLTTLRAQMNPHFIFNALNSIQQYVLQGNVVEANKYLSKFSKLQREVLNHSDQNFISLEKEIEVLTLYLELEQLRFDGQFTYKVEVDASVDTDEIKIPPMIVQPFVENSIWHGLMPKQGERWVHVRFELSSDDLLVCTVTDNGIGREASARLKQNGHTQHKSKGLSLVFDRLNILRQQYEQAFEVNIRDIIDSNNVPAGTEVKLHIYTG